MRVLCEVVLLCVLAFCQAQIYFPTDEICKTKTGEKHCVHVNKCTNRSMKYQLDDYPKPCALQGKHPYVCCETADIKPKAGTKSMNECHKYYKRVPVGPDGYKDFNAIKGPQKTLTENIPHVAALGTQVNDTISWICAGSLISQQFILTAASCLQSKHSNRTINLIRLGDLKLNSNSDNVHPQSFGVSRIITHPKFSPPALYNDIALIEMDRAVKITNYIKPACLQTEKGIKEFIWYVAGYQNSNIEFADELDLEGSRPGADSTCNYYFNELALFNDTLPQGFNEETQICSIDLNPTWSCLKVIGGPLGYSNLNYTEGSWITGVTSIARPCGYDNAPGLHTRISYYIPWIETHVWL